MPEFMRMLTTVILWVMAGSIAIVGLITSDGNVGGAVPIVAISMVVSLFATAAIWTGDRTNTTKNNQTVEKAKRGANSDSRMALLMEMMDEDEREAFKETLKRRILDNASHGGLSDGELPESLSELLDEQPNKRLR